MKQLYIIRGLPGSGKTTLARKLTDNICEADLFFYDADGNYNYDVNKIMQAHEDCQARVKAFMVSGVETVAVANVFVNRWMVKLYLDMAAEFGYEVTEITMSGKLRTNLHGVPGEKIDQMRKAWQL